MDALQRKHHFWDRENRARRSFTKEHVWTFQMYQHFVDLSTYELNMLYCFDLGRHLDGQPLQLMMKDRSVTFTFALSVGHGIIGSALIECLLELWCPGRLWEAVRSTLWLATYFFCFSLWDVDLFRSQQMMSAMGTKHNSSYIALMRVARV